MANNTNIELHAINVLENALLRTEIVTPQINRQDALPTWDGFLTVYNNEESTRKDNINKRIPVQVKGTKVERLSNKPISFAVDIADLKNFERDGGAIFFVVQIKNYDEFRIFYKILLRFDLRKLIASTEEQKTKTIHLEKFPSRHVDGMKKILFEFSYNQLKQGALLPNINSLSDLESSSFAVENCELSLSNIQISSQELKANDLLDRESYIYAKPKELGISFAVDKIRIKEIKFSESKPIIVNGKEYYSEYTVIHKSDKSIELQFGKGLFFHVINDVLKLDYKYKGNLEEQIKDLTFLTTVSDGFSIKTKNEVTLLSVPSSISADIKDFSQRLNWLQRLEKTLKLLKIRNPLDIEKLSEKDYKKINLLIDGILDHKPIKLISNDKTTFGILKIANLKILICCTKDTNSDGVYIKDFKNMTSITFRLNMQGDSVRTSISPYCLLTELDLIDCDNYNFTDILSSVQNYPYTSIYGDLIIRLVLRLLNFYDTIEIPNKIILDETLKLCNYLQEQDKDLECLCKINSLQIEKRRRKLTTKENSYLLSLKNNNANITYQLAANILLESYNEAELLYSQLTQEEKDAFDSFPIKNLWKNPN